MRGFLVVLAVVLSAAGCSGGGDDDDDALTPGGTLSSGTYRVSFWQEVSDGCVLLSDRNFQQYAVSVAGTSLAIDLAPWPAAGAILGSNIVINQPGELDFNTDPFFFGAYDCVLPTIQAIDGVCLGDDVAEVTETQDGLVPSGTQCAETEAAVSELAGAPVTFPCRSRATWRITKLGP